MEIVRFIITLTLFVCGLLLVTRAGFFYLDLFDTYATVVPMMVCAVMEAYAFGWFYKIERLFTEIKIFTKEEIPYYVQFCVKYLDIPILTALAAISFLELVIKKKELTKNELTKNKLTKNELTKNELTIIDTNGSKKYFDFMKKITWLPSDCALSFKNNATNNNNNNNTNTLIITNEKE